ncbi:MAG: PAS domain S-box protein [Pirellulaceae bacterium]|nr:PAS domain S-box protein [Pirellulaceae bacterium]
MGWCNYPLEMVVAEDRDRFACLLQAATCGTSGNDVEFRVTRKDGSLKWFAVSWQPLKHSDDQTMGVRMSKRDISDRKTIEEELKRHTQHLEELASERARRIVELDQRRLQMQKLAALGQMAASVAHEINNPLAGIKNAMRLIRGREQLKPDNKQLFDLVDKEVTRIAGLLSQMYQLCRPSISAPDAGCVVALLDEVVKMVLAQFEFKRIRIRRVNWPVKLIGLVRESEVKQIIHNLLVNACEASPVDGEVNIVLSTNQQTLVLQVVDHGAGIPDHILSRIFEPFVTSKHDSGRVGLGLGLSISNSLAQALDGTIEVQSAMGQGSQFTLSIPFTAVERLG